MWSGAHNATFYRSQEGENQTREVPVRRYLLLLKSSRSRTSSIPLTTTTTTQEIVLLLAKSIKTIVSIVFTKEEPKLDGTRAEKSAAAKPSQKLVDTSGDEDD
jgi:hypothetical protein